MAVSRRQPHVAEPPLSMGAQRVSNMKHDLIEAGSPLTQPEADLLYAAIGDGAAAVAAHVAAGDPHTQYLKETEGLAGKWTPILVNVANLDGSTAFEGQYIRVGATVHAACKVSVDPTAPGVETKLGIPLPVASNFGAEEDCVGSAGTPGIAGQVGAVRADAANNRAELVFIAADVSDQAMDIVFTYEVIP